MVEENDEELVELRVEKVQKDQEGQIGDDENPNLEEDTQEIDESGVWHEKIKTLVAHMRENSQDSMFILGIFFRIGQDDDSIHG